MMAFYGEMYGDLYNVAQHKGQLNGHRRNLSLKLHGILQ